jgi:hypothetical protein
MTSDQLFVKMALSAWEAHTRRTGDFISSLSDEELLKEIAPGKNRGVYLVGHLVAIQDAMNHILGLASRSHAELDEAFLKNPDRSGLDMPGVSTLKQYWADVHQSLNNALRQLTPEEWFKRHNLMSDEDFEKDPSRNKINVLINRTNHLAYHFGQLRLLK